jgi:DNA polymerase-4
MVTARRRCPDLICLPVDMQLYQRGSRKVMETLREFSDQVEVVGADEAYVDLGSSPSLSHAPRRSSDG